LRTLGVWPWSNFTDNHFPRARGEDQVGLHEDKRIENGGGGIFIGGFANFVTTLENNVDLDEKPKCLNSLEHLFQHILKYTQNF
jgi:hypothetical protein